MSGKAIYHYEKTMALNEGQGKATPAKLRLTVVRDAFSNVLTVLAGLLALGGAVLVWRRPLRVRLITLGAAVLLLYMLDTLAGDFYPGQVLAVFLVAAVAFAVALAQIVLKHLYAQYVRLREVLNARREQLQAEGVSQRTQRYGRGTSHSVSKPQTQENGASASSPESPAPVADASASCDDSATTDESSADEQKR